MEHLTESHQYVLAFIDKLFTGLSMIYGVWALHRSTPSKGIAPVETPQNPQPSQPEISHKEEG